LQSRIGYFAFLPSLDFSENPSKKQVKPKFNPTWIFDIFSSASGYFKQLSLFTSDFLEPSKRKKKAANRGTFYKVERVISRRTADGKVR